MSQFDAAIARVAAFGPDVKVGDTDKLSLYGLFKQARHGDAQDKSTPSRFRVVEYAKFNAWKSFKGLSREQAEQKYVDLVKQLDPSWTPPSPPVVADRDDSKTTTLSVQVRPNHNSVAVENGNYREENGAIVNGGGGHRRRGMSLDQHFTFKLKNGKSAPPKLSNALEKALNVSSNNLMNELSVLSPIKTVIATEEESLSSPQTVKTRPRAKSLEFDPRFMVSTLLFEPEQVAENVRQMVIEKNKKKQPAAFQQQRVYEHITGIGNIRDLGGLPAVTANGRPGRVKHGVIIRSAQWNAASEEDVRWLIEHYNLRTIVDFRSYDAKFEGGLSVHFETIRHESHLLQDRANLHPERRFRLNLPLITQKVIFSIIRKRAPMLLRIQLLVLGVLYSTIKFIRRILAPLPLIEVPANALLGPLEKRLKRSVALMARKGFVDAGLQALYEHMLLDGHGDLRRALESIAHPESHPVAFNCSFGKDRTGVVAALLLLALGTPKEKVLEDFALSHTFVDTHLGEREWANSVREMPELVNLKEEWARSPASYLAGAIQAVELAHGSIEKYFKDVMGFDETWIKRLRTNLVETEQEFEEFEEGENRI